MMGNSELYMSKDRRDRRASELKALGFLVRRTHVRNACIHPMYVADYAEETNVKLSAADKGCGNILYQTYFHRLYEVRWGRTRADLYL